MWRAGSLRMWRAGPCAACMACWPAACLACVHCFVLRARHGHRHPRPRHCPPRLRHGVLDLELAASLSESSPDLHGLAEALAEAVELGRLGAAYRPVLRRRQRAARRLHTAVAAGRAAASTYHPGWRPSRRDGTPPGKQVDAMIFTGKAVTIADRPPACPGSQSQARRQLPAGSGSPPPSLGRLLGDSKTGSEASH